jgi:hypothetical protein
MNKQKSKKSGAPAPGKNMPPAKPAEKHFGKKPAFKPAARGKK